MPFEKVKLILIVVVLLILSGYGDAQGFAHAANIWPNGRMDWRELAKSAAGFFVGISLYWLTIRFFQQLGIRSAELQTITWFLVTLVGVALLSGHFARWPWIDQVVAVLVVVGIGWLLFHTGG